MVLMHMDEKWFYAVNTHCNNKVMTSIGMEAHNVYVQHKSHIAKEMYVVCTAFLPTDNDITKGGVTVPIACERVGRMIAAQKDTYKRVYDGNGNMSYPKIAENRL